MKHPKQVDMVKFMGKPCRYIGGDLHRTYLKKKINGRSINDPFSIDDTQGYSEESPVRWKASKVTPKIGFTAGWIVGFGFCFDGSICKESAEDGGYKYFRSTKRHNYVRVRLTPTSKEIKVLAKNIKKVYL